MSSEKNYRWKLTEIVILIVLAVTLGIVWWGWTFLYGLTTPLTAIGLNYLLVGFWFTGGTLIPFIIRKPGAAFFGELAAALVESFITQWGITALLWGLVQGIGAELIFLLTRYKNYNLIVLILAGMLSAIFSYILDFFYMHYSGLSIWVISVQVISVLISGAFFGGVLSYFVGIKVLKSGVIKSITH